VGGKLISIIDFTLIDNKIKQIISRNRAIKTNGSAFGNLIIDVLFPTKSIDNSDIITDAKKDFGIDAIYINKNENGAQINLFQFKYHDTRDNCRRSFPETELHKINSFIRGVLDDSEEFKSSLNQNLRQKISEIHTVLYEYSSCRFVVMICTNGGGLSGQGQDVRRAIFADLDLVDFEELDGHRIVKLLVDRTSLNIEGELSVVDKQVFDRSDGDIKGVIAAVDAVSFIKLITDESDGSVRRYLFDENIRVFLGVEGGYNAKITESALSDENYLFWYQNNGITMVCDKVEYNRSMRSPAIKVKNFQIVNGAQTSYSLVNAYKKDPDKIQDVLLLVKIFETQRPDVAQRVAIATNSQARIHNRDLHSNDKIQLKFENLFSDYGYFYERKKNQHSENELSVRVDAFKLGQVILSYHLGEPERARTESDEIFGSKYNLIFNEFSDFKSIVFMWNLHEEVERRKVELEDLKQRNIKDVSGIAFLPYGNWHVLYTVSLIAKRDQWSIVEKHKIPPIVDESIAILAKIVGDNRDVAYYNMFRSPRMRERIFSSFKNLQFAFDF
jgi:hypothetical protein